MAKDNVDDTLESILKSLPDLSATQLSAIIKRSSTLLTALGGKPEQPTITVDSSDWLFDGLYSVCKDAAGWRIMVRAHMTDTPAWRTYCRHAPGIRANLEAAFKPPLSPAEKKSLGETLATAFLQYVYDRSGVVHLSGLLVRIESYPTAIENAFPGYMANGLMRALLKSRVSEVLANAP